MSTEKTVTYDTGFDDPISGGAITFDVTHSLADWKSIRIKEITQNSLRLIRHGFTYDSHEFAIGEKTEAYLNGMEISKDDLTYPEGFTSKTGIYLIPDAAGVTAMRGAALARIEGVYAGGASLIAQISACTTIEQIDAITDTRS